MLPIFVFGIGSQPWSRHRVTLLMLDLFPTMRGMASSLQGFVHFALSAVVAGTIAPFLVRSLSALALGNGRRRRGKLQPVARLPAPCARATRLLETMKRSFTLAIFAATLAGAAAAAPAVVELPATTLSIGKQKLVAEVAATPEQRDDGSHEPVQPASPTTG